MTDAYDEAARVRAVVRATGFSTEYVRKALKDPKRILYADWRIIQAAVNMYDLLRKE